MSDDKEPIQRIAKILARATSSEASEAQTALNAAYKRMVRDSITLEDLLTLDEQELYQEALIRLVSVILENRTDLSPQAKRLAYSQYIAMISAKFSGGFSQYKYQSSSSEREEQARAYRERNGYSEHTSSPPAPPPEDEPVKKPFFSTLAERVKLFRIGKWTFSFSPAGFFRDIRPLYAEGSVPWLLFHRPSIALRLILASILFGMAFAAIAIHCLIVLYAITGVKLFWGFSLLHIFSFLTALGVLWRLRLFYLEG